MKKATKITKTPPPHPSMDYAFLKKEAIRWVQQLCGDIWTDYNTHDPGVTVLEQLCYAITDLGYRANFDIETLIASKDATDADIRDNAFFPHHKVLPTLPVTLADYRKKIIDTTVSLSPDKPPVSAITNAWVEPVRNHVLGVKGLYRILVQIDDDFVGQESTVQTIRKAVEDVFHNNRNLGEDLHEVIVLREYPISVEASVDLTPDAIPEMVLAQILFALEMAVTPRLTLYTEEELLEEGYSIEEIFDGPLPGRGFIKTEHLQALSKVVYKSRLEKAISGVPGVRRLRNMKLFRKNILVEGDVISFEEEQHVYPIIDTVQKFLQHREVNAIGFYQNNSLVGVDYYTTIHILGGLWANQESGRSHPYRQRVAEVPPKMTGMDDFLPVREQFPAIYGIGRAGLPANAGPQRRAQAKQLQAYLLIFDQILSDYLAQLMHTRMLFSTDPGVGHTYFSKFPGRLDIAALDLVDILKFKVMSQNRQWPGVSAAIQKKIDELDLVVTPGTAKDLAGDLAIRIREQIGRLDVQEVLLWEWEKIYLEQARNDLMADDGERFIEQLKAVLAEDVLDLLIDEEVKRLCQIQLRMEFDALNPARRNSLFPEDRDLKSVSKAKKRIEQTIQTIFRLKAEEISQKVIEKFTRLTPSILLEYLLRQILSMRGKAPILKAVSGLSDAHKVDLWQQAMEGTPFQKLPLRKRARHKDFETFREMGELLRIDPSQFVVNMQEIIQGHDPFFKRRNRFVDHLMARFGLTVDSDLLATLYNYHKDKSSRKLEAEVLRTKLALLNETVRLSRSRSQAFNYQLEKMGQNTSCLEKRLALSLDIGRHRDRSLASILEELNGAGLKFSGRRVKGLNDLVILSDFLAHAHREDQYVVGYDQQNGHFKLYFYSGRGAPHLEMVNRKNLDDIITYKNEMIRFVRDVQKRTERIHLVEHLLLRPLRDRRVRYLLMTEETVAGSRGEPRSTRRLLDRFIEIIQREGSAMSRLSLLSDAFEQYKTEDPDLAIQQIEEIIRREKDPETARNLVVATFGGRPDWEVLLQRARQALDLEAVIGILRQEEDPEEARNRFAALFGERPDADALLEEARRAIIRDEIAEILHTQDSLDEAHLLIESRFASRADLAELTSQAFERIEIRWEQEQINRVEDVLENYGQEDEALLRIRMILLALLHSNWFSTDAAINFQIDLTALGSKLENYRIVEVSREDQRRFVVQILNKENELLASSVQFYAQKWKAEQHMRYFQETIQKYEEERKLMDEVQQILPKTATVDPATDELLRTRMEAVLNRPPTALAAQIRQLLSSPAWVVKLREIMQRDRLPTPFFAKGRILTEKEYKKGFDPELRPFYSQQLSLLFPQWSPRFSELEFHQLIKGLVLDHAPAHLAVRILWLNIEEMVFFEDLYDRWLKLKRLVRDQTVVNPEKEVSDTVGELDELSSQLAQFLQRRTSAG